MSLRNAINAVSTAGVQANAAATIIQSKSGSKSDADKYQENMALALANLAQGIGEFLETQK